MKFLSVDLDYFVGTDIQTRNTCFPVGRDFVRPETILKEWKECYLKYPEIRDIGIIPEFQDLKEFLTTSPKPFRGISSNDNHSFILRAIECISEYYGINPYEECFELVNIDFHHDNYISSGNTLDCANWLRFFVEKYPNNKIIWVKRPDSETKSLLGEFPYNQTEDIKSVLTGEYDGLFTCLSPEWTPPHLWRKFRIFK